MHELEQVFIRSKSRKDISYHLMQSFNHKLEEVKEKAFFSQNAPTVTALQ